MKVLFAGGGTAGHINPAISIAETIKEKRPEAEIAFAGTKKGLESKLVPKAGYPLYEINITGFKRKFAPIANIKAAYCALTSLKIAKNIIRDFKPDIVIGTGGYVAWPLCRAAAKLNIPTLVHEANAYPGIATRSLAKHVDKVLLAFEFSKKYFKDSEKLVYTGNIISNEFIYTKKNDARTQLKIPEKPFLLSFGGSLGARNINEVMISYIKQNKDEKKDLYHVHATGSYGFRWMPQRLFDIGIKNEDNVLNVCEYIYNMPQMMAAADLVICRAGATTIFELAAMGKPAILIPSPNVAENHQYHNAMTLGNAGAAIVIEEKDATPERVLAALDDLLHDDEKLAAMRKAAQGCAVFDANQRICDIVCSLVR